MTIEFDLNEIDDEQKRRIKLLGDWRQYSVTVDPEELTCASFCCKEQRAKQEHSIIHAFSNRFPNIRIHIRESFSMTGPDEKAMREVQIWIWRNYPIKAGVELGMIKHHEPEGEVPSL